MDARYLPAQLAKRPKPKPECLQWHPLEPFCAAGFKDDGAAAEGQVLLIDTRIASPPNELGTSTAGHRTLRCREHIGKGVNALEWLPSTGGVVDSFVTAGTDKRVVLWENVFASASSHQCTILHTMHTAEVSSIALHGNGCIVSTGKDGRLFGYDLASQRIRLEMKHLASKNSNDREMNCVRTSSVFPHLLLYSRNHTIADSSAVRSPGGTWSGHNGSNVRSPPNAPKQRRRQQQWLDLVDVRMALDKPVIQMAWHKQDESKALSAYIVPCWEPTHGRLISSGSTDSVVHLWDIRATTTRSQASREVAGRAKPSLSTRISNLAGQKVLCGAWLPNMMVSMVSAQLFALVPFDSSVLMRMRACRQEKISWLRPTCMLPARRLLPLRIYTVRSECKCNTSRSPLRSTATKQSPPCEAKGPKIKNQKYRGHAGSQVLEKRGEATAVMQKQPGLMKANRAEFRGSATVCTPLLAHVAADRRRLYVGPRSASASVQARAIGQMRLV
jgi:WD40 repeat protein